MATELAKAYVQIMPSADGIKGKLTEALGGEATTAGTAAGASFGANLVGKLKGVIAEADIGKLFSEAINEGAALEQNIGGIETLFKENADTVKKYADEAYRTAGMSANDYMETVTGFSASLLQGLSGDTAAAAETANMAVVDMSDNANKMGTSIESIQNAYSGFAKQNYTMLDNLKLGYGGTKTEMERLLADAEKISGVKYDISNLGDVYNAIHVIQGEMEISGRTAEEAAEIYKNTGREVSEQLGTTAKEASTTLSGSMASMKSAVKNLLGNIATGEDLGPSLYALEDTVFTFLKGNLIPMVGNVLKGLPEAVNSVLGMSIRGMNLLGTNMDAIIQSGIDIVSELVVGIISALPYLGEAAISMVVSLGNALLNTDWIGVANNIMTELTDNMDLAAGEILGTDGNIIASLLSAITNDLPNVLSKGTEIIINLVNGILQSLPEIWGTAGQIANQLLDGILTNLPVILQGGAQLILGLVQGIISNLPDMILAGVQIITQLLATITQHLPNILQEGITIVGELIAGLIASIPDIIRSVPKLIAGIVDTFTQYDWKSLGGSIIDGIVNGLKAAGSSIITAILDACSGAFEAVKNFFGIASPSKLMRDEIGRWIPAGIAEGIRENTKPLSVAMDELARETTGNLQADLVVSASRNGSSLSGASLSGQRAEALNPGGYTQNVYITSPTALSPYEVARQTRNANRQMILAMKGI